MMAEARVVKTAIDGLDLVLGGGVRVLERVPGAGDSASLLVRGSAGTGKTLLANHIAAALARQLLCDVVVACVELLPPELEAQLAGFERTRPLLPVRWRDDVSGEAPRVFAQVVEPDLGQKDDPVGGPIVRLLEWVERNGGAPRVLVVDSLSDGYGLGGKIERKAADALVRLAAARGLCLVLVEEVQQLRPSPWCFVVDTVIELRLERLAGSSREERTLTVTKNRLGPSDAGPHELALGGGKLMVLPEPEAWDRAWAGGWWKLPVTAATGERGWNAEALDACVQAQKLARFKGSTTLVRGSDPVSARRWAMRLGGEPTGDDSASVFISLQQDGTLVRGPIHGDALASPHRFQAVLIERFNALHTSTNRVVIGDLSSLQHYAHSDALHRVIARTAQWLRALGVPLVMYETAPVRFRPMVPEVVPKSPYEPLEGTSFVQRYGETVVFELIPITARTKDQVGTPRNPVIVSDLASGTQFVLEPPSDAAGPTTEGRR